MNTQRHCCQNDLKQLKSFRNIIYGKTVEMAIISFFICLLYIELIIEIK